MNKTIFSGVLILVCCLFVEIGAIEAKSAYDISGECIILTTQGTMGPGTVSPEDICLSAGLGSCKKGHGQIRVYGTDNCTGASGARNLLNCSDVIGGGIRKSAKLANLICKPRTWGMVPQPANVPGDLRETIMNATNWILGFASIIATLAILWGGVNYLTAAGDEDKAMTGKKTIKYGVMGLVIMGIAYAVVIAVLAVLK